MLIRQPLVRLVALASVLICSTAGPAFPMNESFDGGSRSWLQPQLSAAHYPISLHCAVEKLNHGLAQAQAELAANDFEDALKSIEHLEPTLARGELDEALMLRGLALEKLGRTEEALAAYDRSLFYRTDSPFTIFRRGMVLFNLRRYPEAVRSLKEVSWRTRDNQSEVLYALAQVLSAQGDTAGAAQALESSYSLDPNFVPAAKLLVSTRLKQLDSVTDAMSRRTIEDQAVGSLMVITAKHPEDEKSAYLLASLLVRQGNTLLAPEKLSQAEALAQRLVRMTGFRSPEYARLLFDTQLKLGKREDARETLRQALEHSPSSPVLESAKKQLELETASTPVPSYTQ